jgi:hypothetical protein
MRLAEAAAWLDRNQNMMAIVTLTMIMATLICVGPMVSFSLSHADRTQKPEAPP